MARELFNQMAQMALRSVAGNSRPQGSIMSRMQGAMNRSNDELQQILQEQQEILMGTESTHKESAQVFDELREKAVEHLAAGAQADLAVLAHLLAPPDLESDRLRAPAERERNAAVRGLLSGLRDMFENRDFDAFAKQFGPVNEELAALGPLDEARKAALAHAHGAGAGIRRHRQHSRPGVDSGPETRGPRARHPGGRAGKAHHRPRREAALPVPTLSVAGSQDRQQHCRGRRGSWAKRPRELGSLQLRQAIPPEQEAINRLSQSSQQMQQAMQRMAQRGRFGRVPLVHVFRRGRFLPSGQFLPPTGRPQFPEHDIDENLTGLDTEKFKLPGKDDYKPEHFRKEVLESLKQGVPDRYKGPDRALLPRVVPIARSRCGRFHEEIPDIHLWVERSTSPVPRRAPGPRRRGFRIRARSSAPDHPDIEKARELLGAWRVEEARPVVEGLLEAQPESVDALDLAALLAYYEGAYAKALATVERALAIDGENDQRQGLRLLLQADPTDVIRNFKRYESDHFLIHLHEESDGILAAPALEALEQAHQEVGRALGYWPRSKVRVEIGSDVQSFGAITTFTLRDIEQTGAIGLCKFNKVMIISPRVMAHGYRCSTPWCTSTFTWPSST